MNDVHDSERELTSALRALARDVDGRAAASNVEARLRAEVRAIGAARRARIRWRIGLTAAVVAAAAIPAWKFTVRDPRSGAIQPDAARVAATSAIGAPPREEVTTAFLPLVYSDVPVAGAQIVRLSVPRSALASFGLTPPESASAQDSASSGPAGTVIADVVVGDDGLARAVRFVRTTAPAGSTERMEHTR